MFRTCAAVNVPEKDSEPVAVFSLFLLLVKLTMAASLLSLCCTDL